MEEEEGKGGERWKRGVNVKLRWRGVLEKKLYNLLRGLNGQRMRGEIKGKAGGKED